MTVLDASPMIAYLRAESGGEVVRSLLMDPNAKCVAHAINVMEVYYDFLRISDGEAAEAAIASLLTDGVVIRDEMDPEFWKDAGRLKVNHKLSVADTFCLALARRLGCELYTTDHHEMDPLVGKNICKIRFIR